MVDEARVTALLHRLRSELDAIARSVDRPDEALLTDSDALPALKYRLIVAVEACVDVADHVISSETLRPGASFADSFASLGEAGWVPEELADQLADAARFRNLLVHQYADVDDARVVAIARERMADLEAFRAAVATRLAGEGSSGGAGPTVS